MKKLLILGSEGYLGTVLVPFLSKNNYEIVGVDQCLFGKKNKYHPEGLIINGFYTLPKLTSICKIFTLI